LPQTEHATIAIFLKWSRYWFLFNNGRFFTDKINIMSFWLCVLV